MNVWSSVLRTILKTRLATTGNSADYLLVSGWALEGVLLADTHISASPDTVSLSAELFIL